MSTTTAPHRSPSRPRSPAARRGGYLGTIVVDGILLFLINGWPGWSVLTFLTQDMTLVLPWINASLLAGVIVNLVYLAADPRWLRALGSIVTAVVGLVTTIRMWQIFPFEFAGAAVDWALLLRIALVLGIIGCAIGIVVAVVAFIRTVAHVGDR